MKRTAYAALTGAVVLLGGCGALSQVNQGATGAAASATKPAATPPPPGGAWPGEDAVDEQA